MAWVYPDTLIGSEQWFPQPNNWNILDTLALGDNEFAYTPAGIYSNYLSVSFPQLCSSLHIRARRGTGFSNIAGIVVQVNNSQTSESTQYTIGLADAADWTDFFFTPSHLWDSVYLEGVSVDVLVGVSVLRGETAGLPTRRTLTGVGI